MTSRIALAAILCALTGAGVAEARTHPVADRLAGIMYRQMRAHDAEHGRRTVAVWCTRLTGRTYDCRIAVRLHGRMVCVEATFQWVAVRPAQVSYLPSSERACPYPRA